MGTWGSLPWDNDAAADWFGNVFDKTKLAKHVENALKLDAEDGYEEIRAAATVVLLLCHNYVWPVDDIDRHLELAVARLEELSGLDECQEDPDTLAQIQAEIAVLKARIESSGEFGHPKWWQY
jgi:hypothetical protein